MPDRVFCIGNGENRLSFPIEKLKGKGKIYGCNAIYRDNPDVIDVLTSVDYGICHEIYHSGYSQKNEVFLIFCSPHNSTASLIESINFLLLSKSQRNTPSSFGLSS